MFFAGIMIIIQTLLRSIGEARVRLVASSLAQAKLETTRNLPYVDVGVVGGIPNGLLEPEEVVAINGQNFSVNTSIVYIDDPFDDIAPIDVIPTDYKRVRIEVDWDGTFKPLNPLVFLSDVVPPSLETGSNTGTLSIQVINASGQPVSSADVTIVANSVVPPINLTTVTDSNGWLVLPGSPICVECYSVTVSKSGYSTDKTYSTAEVANPLKPHLTVLDGQLTHISFAIDRLATLTVRASRSRQAGYTPFPGVQFTLKGAKTVGTNTLDEVVYKHQSNHVTAAFGQVVVSGLEWDTYDLYFPGGSSIDIAGAQPLIPFGLSPGVSSQVSIVTEANTTNSLLVAAANPSEQLLANATFTLSQNGVPVATKSAGATGFGDVGQAYFGGLSQSTYDLLAQLSGYQDATGSVTINGDIKELLYLNEN